jgi:hypothetical protein
MRTATLQTGVAAVRTRCHCDSTRRRGIDRTPIQTTLALKPDGPQLPNRSHDVIGHQIPFFVLITALRGPNPA